MGRDDRQNRPPRFWPLRRDPRASSMTRVAVASSDRQYRFIGWHPHHLVADRLGFAIVSSQHTAGVEANGAGSEDSGIRRTENLLRLDIGRPDHFAPLFRFVDDELAEVGSRTRNDRAPQVRTTRLDPWIGKAPVPFPIKPVNN